MHESSLVEALLDVVRKALKDYTVQHPDLPVPKVEEIICEAGLLAVVEPNAMQACFEIFVEGTELEQARLITEIRPLACRCLHCQERFLLRERKFVCPACKSEVIKFENAGGCLLKAIKVKNGESHG